MSRVLVSRLLAASLALAASATLGVQAAPDVSGPTDPPKKSGDLKDVLVPIPSYSKDVENNGCHVRASPQEIFGEADADLKHVPFDGLIHEVVGRYSVRAVIDPPAVFASSLDTLDPQTRNLVLLEVLRDGLGRDGLHTFFFLKAGGQAPSIRDALQAAGLTREHKIFLEAMSLFGPNYPTAEEERAKRFSYSSLDTPLNDFDHRMLALAKDFGTSEAFSKAMTSYVERTPALWKRIEAERSHLGEIARLRFLNRSLLERTRTWEWDRSDAAPIAARLAAMPKEQRTLLVMEIFNAEFENGGVHQFFLNSSGGLAPEVYDAFVELGLPRQAAIFKRGLDMFGAKYMRDTDKRRARSFDHGDWTDWDKKLQGLTDEFYTLDGGPTVVKLNQGAAVAGGPGIWPAMAVYARNKGLLPC